MKHYYIEFSRDNERDGRTYWCVAEADSLADLEYTAKVNRCTIVSASELAEDDN